MNEKERALAEAIHEVADIVVNWGGYPDDPQEANRRAAERDKLESDLHAFIAQRGS